MQGLSFKAYQDKECISIKDRMFKLQKLSGLYKDYGSNFYNVWLEAFINYISILVSLFGTSATHLQASFTQFYGTVLWLLKV